MDNRKVYAYVTWSELEHEDQRESAEILKVLDPRMIVVLGMEGRLMNDDDVEPFAYSGYRSWMEEQELDPVLPVVLVHPDRFKELLGQYPGVLDLVYF
jgi:hypothetical protein